MEKRFGKQIIVLLSLLFISVGCNKSNTKIDVTQLVDMDTLSRVMVYPIL